MCIRDSLETLLRKGPRGHHGRQQRRRRHAHEWVGGGGIHPAHVARPSTRAVASPGRRPSTTDGEMSDESLFRSAAMSLIQLYIPSESVHATVTELAELGNVQFKDVRPATC